ncbi:uncharacterized protein AB675_9776 [Cyphellophora attinorum]|uniref:Uncharacterized protein n=1 Tax=Cyphellophora attinorum TaxID=1664694 RepID=A0A0N1P0T5_9EURO|nr:uncharacterized protein AB675_9776 [Phialophora attinorum]KPI42583.1 hypothetical protein AB675_9776 [Phialophora attinorum]
MLGAQTRAAEYHAAKKASARQASREAEEQKLPPPTAPISLSAYTRSAQPSRNKDPEQQQKAFETPSRRRSTPEDGSGSVSESSSVTKPRVMLPTVSNVPSMPRNVLVPGGPPPHFQHSNFAFQADGSFPQHGLHWTHMPMPPAPTYPFEHYDQQYHRQQTLGQIHAPSPFVRNQQNRPVSCMPELNTRSPRPVTPTTLIERFTFGPDDMSPGKYETKLHIRSRLPSDEQTRKERESGWSDEGDSEGPLMNPIRVREPSSDETDISPLKRQIILEGVPDVPPTVRPPLRQRYESEESADASYQQGLLPNPLRRYTDADMTSDGPIATAPWNRSTVDNNAMIVNASSRSQYERYSKMQKFEAVQQVLSKKGKTVLNNPERKVASVNVPASATSIHESGPGPSMTEDEVKSLPCVTEPSLQAPSGLLKHTQATEVISDRPESTEPRLSQTDAELRESFGVMSDDWFNLRPATLQDRKQMQAAFKYVRDKDARIGLRLLQNPTFRNERLKALEWFSNRDSREIQTARQQVDPSAKNHSVHIYADTESRIPGDSRLDNAGGVIHLAGDILAKYKENNMKSSTGPDYYNHRSK